MELKRIVVTYNPNKIVGDRVYEFEDRAEWLLLRDAPLTDIAFVHANVPYPIVEAIARNNRKLKPDSDQVIAAESVLETLVNQMDEEEMQYWEALRATIDNDTQA